MLGVCMDLFTRGVMDTFDMFHNTTNSEQNHN